MDELIRLAKHKYAVYMASCSGLNYQGMPCPMWDALTDAVRSHWISVARDSMLGLFTALDAMPDPVMARVMYRKYAGDEEIAYANYGRDDLSKAGE